jgi:hypothetical protein
LRWISPDRHIQHYSFLGAWPSGYRLADHLHRCCPPCPAAAAIVGAPFAFAVLVTARLYSLYKGGFPAPSLVATASGAAALLAPRHAAAGAYSAVCAALAVGAGTLWFAGIGSISPIVS